MSISSAQTALASEQLQLHKADGTIKDAVVTAASLSADVNFPLVCEGRLTLTTSVPITTSDVTGATSVYFTLYKGNRIALYDGTKWVVRAFSEITIALGTLTSGLPYDLFAYDNAGVVAFDAPLAWTNGTTRATALTTQNGVLVKSGATTRRYIGTFYTTSTTQTEDSESKRYLWNYYNRVPRFLLAKDVTNTWTYTTASTWRAANANTTDGVGRVSVVVGYSEDLIEAEVYSLAEEANGAAVVSSGVGIDSTSVNTAQILAAFADVANNTTLNVAKYVGYPGPGQHFIQRLEAMTGPTAVYMGDNGSTFIQTGMTVKTFG